MTTENSTANTKLNYLKTRDDKEITVFEESDGKFKPSQPDKCAWLKDKDENLFTEKELRARIEPWLTALFQSEHLSLLIGSGLTHAVHYLATGNGAKGMDKIKLSVLEKHINAVAESSANNSGRENGNIEDQIRVANELLRGLEILRCKKAQQLRKEITDNLRSFSECILKNENNIGSAEDEKQKETAFNTLINFLMSFASRTGTRDRLNIFTTNYDRLIEAGSELAGLHLLDRFLGNLMPIFRSSRMELDIHYNPPGIRGEPRFSYLWL